MILVVLLGLLLVTIFFACWFLELWCWPLAGHGSNSQQDLVASSCYKLEKRLETGAQLWRLAADDGSGLPLLFLLGMHTSAHQETQFLLATAFLDQGFSVYLLDYGSLCDSQQAACEASWTSDILAAAAYLGDCKFVVARSMACPLLLRLMISGSFQPQFVAMITPVVALADFVPTCYTKTCLNSGNCVAKLPRGISCIVYYFQEDIFMHPLCRARNVQYVELPASFQHNELDLKTNIHCLGPRVLRNYIARHFKCHIKE